MPREKKHAKIQATAPHLQTLTTSTIHKCKVSTVFAETEGISFLLSLDKSASTKLNDLPEMIYNTFPPLSFLSKWA